VVALCLVFPRVLGFVELAARELRYLWWLVFMIALGVWLAFFFWQLSSRPLMPVNDPQLPSVLAQAHEHQHSEDFIDEAAA